MGWHMYFSENFFHPKRRGDTFSKSSLFWGWCSSCLGDFIFFNVHHSFGEMIQFESFSHGVETTNYTSRFLRKFGIAKRDWGWFQMMRGFLIHQWYYRYDANDCARKTDDISHQTGKRNITSSFHPPFILIHHALIFFFGCSSWFGQKPTTGSLRCWRYDRCADGDASSCRFSPLGLSWVSHATWHEVRHPQRGVVFTRGNPEPQKNAMKLLGGGFKYVFIFTPTWGKWSNLTNIFSDGWFNHQLDLGLAWIFVLLIVYFLS